MSKPSPAPRRAPRRAANRPKRLGATALRRRQGLAQDPLPVGLALPLRGRVGRGVLPAHTGRGQAPPSGRAGAGHWRGTPHPCAGAQVRWGSSRTARRRRRFCRRRRPMPAKSPKVLVCGHPECASRGTGGGGRPDDLDPGGRLSRRDEPARQALRSIRRSLVSAPAADHRRSRWRWPAAGRGTCAPPLPDSL